MATILVTGCNRGIGLELCRQLKERGDTVIGVCRNTNDELDALGIRLITGIDVASDSSVAELKAALGDTKLDVLLNNAGILLDDSFGSINYGDMMKQYQVNTLGPLRVTEALIGNLAENAKVGIVSSRVGSISDNGSGNHYGYRASKTAVNQVGMNLMHELKPAGISVALLHPGLVATEMTGGRGISAIDSAAGLIARMDDLNLENSGSFWHAEGYELPW